MKIPKINWLLFFFCAVSFLISQWASFYKNVTSTDLMYAYTSGDVEWWIRLLSYKVQIVWLVSFAIILGVRRKRLSVKQAIQVGIYFSTAVKDICDWFDNNNQETKLTDWTITIVALMLVELLSDWAEKIIRKYIKPLFHFKEEDRFTDAH